jgi:hypothetical protein
MRCDWGISLKAKAVQLMSVKEIYQNDEFGWWR